MKKIALLFFGFISTAMLAQKTEITIKQDFNEIKLYNKIHATLIKSTENKVVFFGADEDKVSAKVKRGTLRIKSSLGDIWNDSQTHVKIYYKSVNSIDVNEGSKLEVSDKIDQKNLTLSAQEGASINASVNLDKLEVKVYSGGNISLTGNAISQTVKIKAGGTYDGKDLTTKTTAVNVSAGGLARVEATASCDAKTQAGGNIYVYGNPDKFSKKTVLGGTIEKK